MRVGWSGGAVAAGARDKAVPVLDCLCPEAEGLPWGTLAPTPTSCAPPLACRTAWAAPAWRTCRQQGRWWWQGLA